MIIKLFTTSLPTFPILWRLRTVWQSPVWLFCLCGGLSMSIREWSWGVLWFCRENRQRGYLCLYLWCCLGCSCVFPLVIWRSRLGWWFLGLSHIWGGYVSESTVGRRKSWIRDTLWKHGGGSFPLPEVRRSSCVLMRRGSHTFDRSPKKFMKSVSNVSQNWTEGGFQNTTFHITESIWDGKVEI